MKATRDPRGRIASAFALTESGWSVNPTVGFENGDLMAAVLPDEGEALGGWEIQAHPAAVTSPSFDAARKVILSGHRDGACLLFDFRTGERIDRFGNYPQAVTASAASPDGDYFLTGCADGLFRVWRGDAQAPIAEMAGPNGR